MKRILVILLSALLTCLTFAEVFADDKEPFIVGLYENMTIPVTYSRESSMGTDGRHVTIMKYKGNKTLNLSLSTKENVSFKVKSSPGLTVKYKSQSNIIEITNETLIPGDTATVTITALYGGNKQLVKEQVFKIADGSKQYPIFIANATDLSDIPVTGLGKNYIQVENLDLSSFKEWTPIGQQGAPFSGSYDGNGKTINCYSGLNKRDYLGLFGYISTNDTIKNINMTVDFPELSLNDYKFFGIFAGYIENSNIENITISGNVKIETGSSVFGGIAGRMTDVKAKDILYKGNLQINGNNSKLGGITTSFRGSIENVEFNGNLKVIGKNCNISALTVSNDGEIRNAKINGKIDISGADSKVGGIAASNKGSIEKTISNSKITVRGDKSLVGGLVSFNNGVINSCVSKGEIKVIGEECYIGGIAAQNQFAEITSCKSENNILTEGRFAVAGGISGYNYAYVDQHSVQNDDSVFISKIENCLVIGDVQAKNSPSVVGGIVGRNQTVASAPVKNVVDASVLSSYVFNKTIRGSTANRIIGEDLLYADLSISTKSKIFTNIEGNLAGSDILLNNSKPKDNMSAGGLNGQSTDSAKASEIIKNFDLALAES